MNLPEDKHLGQCTAKSLQSRPCIATKPVDMQPLNMSGEHHMDLSHRFHQLFEILNVSTGSSP